MSSSCLNAEDLLGSILRHFLTILLLPLLFLLALLYKLLHPNRAEKYLALVRDYRSLAGLGSANKTFFAQNASAKSRSAQPQHPLHPSSSPSALDLS